MIVYQCDSCRKVITKVTDIRFYKKHWIKTKTETEFHLCSECWDRFCEFCKQLRGEK